MDEPIRLRALTSLGLPLGWLACAVCAGAGRPWAGFAAAAGLIVWHLRSRRGRVRELKRLAAVGALGLALESGALAAGLYGYAGGWSAWWLAPAWIVALWVLLGASLETSLGWLNGRPRLAAALGAAAGPLVFAADAKLGAARFLVPAPAGSAALAALWAAALPLAFAVSRRAGGSL